MNGTVLILSQFAITSVSSASFLTLLTHKYHPFWHAEPSDRQPNGDGSDDVETIVGSVIILTALIAVIVILIVIIVKVCIKSRQVGLKGTHTE